MSRATGGTPDESYEKRVAPAPAGEIQRGPSIDEGRGPLFNSPPPGGGDERGQPVHRHTSRLGWSLALPRTFRGAVNARRVASDWEGEPPGEPGHRRHAGRVARETRRPRASGGDTERACGSARARWPPLQFLYDQSSGDSSEGMLDGVVADAKGARRATGGSATRQSRIDRSISGRRRPWGSPGRSAPSHR